MCSVHTPSLLTFGSFCILVVNANCMVMTSLILADHLNWIGHKRDVTHGHSDPNLSPDPNSTVMTTSKDHC